MARENQKAADDRRTPEHRRSGDGRAAQNGNNDWYGGERENEFGGEGRFRADGGHGAQGSHFGGEPEALREDQPGHERNTNAWRGERRKQFIEKFDRWRSERAARAAHGGPGNAPSESAPAAGRGRK